MIVARLRSQAGWLAPALCACLLIVGFAVESSPGLSGDTIALVHGAHTISHCISAGTFSHCDSQATWTGLDGVSTDVYHGVIEGDVGPYPIFQYVPALVLEHLGFGDMSVLRGLELVSMVSLCVAILLGTWLAAKTGRRWAAPAAVLALSTSPLLFYAGQTLGESLAAMLVILFAVAALRRWPPAALALCALLACITKETMFPIALLLGFAALRATPVAGAELRRAHWYGLVAGVASAVVVNALFNIFRYGQVTNFTYGHPYDQVPGLIRRLTLAVAVWIAPNGGLAIFWVLGGVLVVALIVLTARTSGLVARLPGLALIGALLILTGTLASWYSPFGWVGWGPRLMLPVLPATALLILVLYAEPIEVGLRWLCAERWRLLPVALALTALALPEVNILHAPVVLGSIFTPDQTCPTSITIAEPSYYYHCIAHLAWGRHWLLLSSYRALGHAWGVVFAVAFAAAWAMLIVAIARSFGGPGVPERRTGRPAHATAAV